MRGHAVFLLAGILTLAGCIGPVGYSAPPEPEPEPFPGFPETVTAESAGEYASQYEEVYRHNTILATADVETITSITVGCSPTSITVVGDGFRVTVECGFGWMYTDEGSEAVVDGRPYEATYWIGNGLAERIGSTLADAE